jgi:hypothetical protein
MRKEKASMREGEEMDGLDDLEAFNVAVRYQPSCVNCL